jgi:glycosyltransferase involved in cell wall biosynthesis
VAGPLSFSGGLTRGSTRVQIVMITPGLPQPTGAGAAIRNWHVLQFLVRGLGARVQIYTFAGPHDQPPTTPLPAGIEVTVLPRPARAWRRRLGVLASSGRPDLADRLWSAEAQTKIVWQTLRQEIDLVHIGGLEVGRYGREIIEHRPPGAGPAVVLDDFNAEYLLQRRAALTDLASPRRWPIAAYSLIQWRRLRRFERALCRAVDAVVCVSRADAAAVSALGLVYPPAIIPNGVDTQRYRPVPPDQTDLPRFDLVFSGSFDYRPNIDAARWLTSAVWPALRARLPRLTLGLVGQNPAPAIRALGRLPGVTVTGPVPDDRPFLWGAGLYVVPMRYGGGARLKLLNALAAGCAVVSTSMGAEGVGVTPGRDLLIADGARDWVRGCMQLLANEQQRAELATAGRDLVERYYDWSQLIRSFGAVYDVALRRRANGEIA